MSVLALKADYSQTVKRKKEGELVGREGTLVIRVTLAVREGE